MTGVQTCALPIFFYIYGLSLLISHLLAGGTVIIENGFMYPTVVLDSIEKLGATGFAGVSSHYSILLTQSDLTARTLKTLRYFAEAGDKMPVWITKKIILSFPGKEMYLMYGQTEASPRLAYLDPKKAGLKPDSVGKAVPGVELKVIHETGESCSAGDEGEIVARGANIMAGYWRKPDETARVIKDGWLHTGDLGHQDAEGDLFITGRKSDLLKVGGHRISPVEIERIAGELEGIKEAVVLGLPEKTLGHKIILCFIPHADSGLTETVLLDFFKKKLPPYKMPHQFIRVGEIPKNSTGKVDRKKLAGSLPTHHLPKENP